MRPIGVKERRELLLQYCMLFVISAVIFLLALFLTRSNNDLTMTEQDRLKYNEFLSFDKNAKRVIYYVDTTLSQADRIASEGGKGSLAKDAADGLVEEFNTDKYINAGNNPLLKNIGELLKTGILNASGKKKFDADYALYKKELEKCEEGLKDKKLFDVIKAQQPAAAPATND